MINITQNSIGRELSNLVTFLVNSDWLIPYKEDRPGAVTQPPEVYFCQSKLDVWSHVADQAIEALASCKQHLGQFLENTHRDIVSQLTGMQQTFYFSLFI